ncbi:hypothetical protein BG28_08590 [Nesterenkonia sp. AN1]|uniref:Uncharacterized protein n=1 Tax=Nesterenkonia aurantiaca TaxID=1436010 RepID=A0A4R7G6J0_9MICC|nr:hypothetical protein [Nesterenkonia]EXF24034.1 hypothetical protein BG28_08590 [Nesterenkonia sp. AN1]TDS86967.1 hypothetical protein EV640_102262 [Nesterenkonia aurantiaca]
MTRPPSPPVNFVETMTSSGTPRSIAEELERRIEIVESAEAHQDARQPLSIADIGVYVAATVLACLIGLAVMAL